MSNIVFDSPWKLWKPFRVSVSILFAGIIVATLGNVFLRWSIGDIVDKISVGNEEFYRSLLAAVLAMVVVMALQPPLQGGKALLEGKIRKSIYEKLQHHALHSTAAALGQQEEGALTTYYTRDTDELIRFVGRIQNIAFPDAVKWLLTVSVFFLFHPALGITAFLLTFVFLLVVVLMSKSVARGAKGYNGALDRVNQELSAGLYNIETIKAAGMEDRFIGKVNTGLGLLQKAKYRLAFWESLLGAPLLCASFFANIVMMAVGGYLVLAGSVSAGQLLAVITLTDYIISPMMSLSGTMSAFRRVKISCGRLRQYCCQEEENLREDGREVDHIEKISFRQVSFSYSGKAEHMVLKQFSEDWERGNLYLMKGGNGQGKSTLMKLLEGLYPLSGGGILINGFPAADFSVKSLRGHIVAMSQENVLFMGTIIENLTLGNDASEAQVEEACRKVGIHEEILQMPDKYQTFLTQGGGTLSGGQKQRLCLARTLLSKGDVYLFDEPSSAIGERHREYLQGVLEELARDKIVVVITHDDTLLKNARHITTVG